MLGRKRTGTLVCKFLVFDLAATVDRGCFDRCCGWLLRHILHHLRLRCLWLRCRLNRLLGWLTAMWELTENVLALFLDEIHATNSRVKPGVNNSEVCLVALMGRS